MEASIISLVWWFFFPFVFTHIVYLPLVLNIFDCHYCRCRRQGRFTCRFGLDDATGNVSTIFGRGPFGRTHLVGFVQISHHGIVQFHGIFWFLVFSCHYEKLWRIDHVHHEHGTQSHDLIFEFLFVQKRLYERARGWYRALHCRVDYQIRPTAQPRFQTTPKETRSAESSSSPVEWQSISVEWQ